MTRQIDELIRRINELEDELEQEFVKKREAFQYIIEKKRVRFAEEVTLQQHRLKTGLVRYLAQARPLNVLTAPLIYSGLAAFAALDLFLFVYQSLCFPIYGILKVRRVDHFVFDRQDLPYLNMIERFNCFYCSYGNGLAGYFREIAARTEQYWCPIKNGRRIVASHSRYPRFFEYGDAESYRRELAQLRAELMDQEAEK
ncbi:hypothetical protein THSYN_26175 [Candidatus Thiodictyon syntrophicum]|uniref:Uncharacterized protein n=2 Tax=Candidatus Thiodictyon syntrophicum TaxID=1166950 RepID=A0A2K8UES9_9GAMM|nr:hypothetical protein THSYN_26175 [Candidatus Thiodictyon syntrophicum]